MMRPPAEVREVEGMIEPFQPSVCPLDRPSAGALQPDLAVGLA
jgi:hypothetical protein